jgi:hypothetical protein
MKPSPEEMKGGLRTLPERLRLVHQAHRQALQTGQPMPSWSDLDRLTRQPCPDCSPPLTPDPRQRESA